MAQPDAEFIKRLKQIVGENVSGFARELSIPQPSLHGYLTGRYTPGFDFFLKLAKRGVDLNWLLTGSPSMPTKGKKKDQILKAQKIAVLLSELGSEDTDIATKTLRALVRALTESRSR